MPRCDLAGPRGPRTVPLASFFTGYRRTVLAPDELITAIEIPKPLPEFVRFYKVAKRRMDDISTVAAAMAMDWDASGRVARARFAFGGVAAVPLRALAAEEAVLGQRWNEAAVERVQAALERNAQADQRSSRIGRIPAWQWPRAWSRSSCGSGGRRRHEDCRKGRSRMKARASTSPAKLFTPTICFCVFHDRCTPGRCYAPHAHALVKASMSPQPCRSRAWPPSLPRDDVPGEGDSGSNRHDEPLFPTEVMYHSQPVAWVLGETLDAAQRGAGRVSVEYEPLPAILTIEDAIAAGSFHSAPLRLARGDASVIESSPLHFEGELQIGGQEHFYLETQCAIAWLDETGGVAAHSSTQHPTETQEVIARVLGIPRNR